MMDESDSLIPCPYNKSHVLYKSRMQTHLKKCSYANLHPQQNVEPIKMKICQFNTNHHVPAAELEEHHRNCPDIGNLTRFITVSNSGKGSVVPYYPIDLPPTDENWDDDANHDTYNPEEHATTGVILRAAQGLPKAERKTFRMRERERINRLRENEESFVKDHKAVPKPQPMTVVEKHAFTEQALRHPKEGQLGMGRGRQLAKNPGLSGDDDFAMPGIGRAYTLKGMGDGLQSLPPMRPKGPPAVSSVSSISSVGSSDSRPSSASSMADADGFIEQRSKKNKKKGYATGATSGQVPDVSGQASVSRNPLTSPGSSSTFSFPGVPGKGRGRLRKDSTPVPLSPQGNWWDLPASWYLREPTQWPYSFPNFKAGYAA